MTRVFWISGLLVAIGLAGMELPARAEVDFAFPVGLSFVSGALAAAAANEDAYDADHPSSFTDSTMIPIGPHFRPYCQFDEGSMIFLDVGPAMIVLGGIEYFDLPLGVCYGRNFPDLPVTPYFRAGLRVHFASGDYVEGRKPGPVVAVGVNLFQRKRVKMSLELAYDGAEVTFESDNGSYKKDVKVGGIITGASVVF